MKWTGEATLCCMARSTASSNNRSSSNRRTKARRAVRASASAEAGAAKTQRGVWAGGAACLSIAGAPKSSLSWARMMGCCSRLPNDEREEREAERVRARPRRLMARHAPPIAVGRSVVASRHAGRPEQVLGLQRAQRVEAVVGESGAGLVGARRGHVAARLGHERGRDGRRRRRSHRGHGRPQALRRPRAGREGRGHAVTAVETMDGPSVLVQHACRVHGAELDGV
eukprot:scaffold9115_cov115-Isochrysis_galbana.AAC.2